MKTERIGAGMFSCLALILAACGQAAPEAQVPETPVPQSETGERQPVALMTTLPIYWPETAGFGDLLEQEGEQPWVRRQLEQDYRIEPLDYLGDGSLDPYGLLLMAQPRALSGPENVALDEWVRKGGRLVLFADPLVTMHSRYGIADRRRPQAVALLSPILARWGLELAFDENQDEGRRVVSAFDTEFPVDLAGTLRKVEVQAPADCALSTGGHVAQCTIGKGMVVVIADTALLDPDSGAHDSHAHPESSDKGGAAALKRLLALGFAG